MNTSKANKIMFPTLNLILKYRAILVYNDCLCLYIYGRKATTLVLYFSLYMKNFRCRYLLILNSLWSLRQKNDRIVAIFMKKKRRNLRFSLKWNQRSYRYFPLLNEGLNGRRIKGSDVWEGWFMVLTEDWTNVNASNRRYTSLVCTGDILAREATISHIFADVKTCGLNMWNQRSHDTTWKKLCSNERKVNGEQCWSHMEKKNNSNDMIETLQR